jgi:alpha-amylase
LLVSAFTGFPISQTTTDVSAVTTDVAETSANEYGLLDNVEGGLILHCWCWSFNTIKSNLEKIAEAGYTAVQTSPITKCVVGNGGNKNLEGNWYYHYQPTAYTIGNYQLGTEAEFKSMCQEAEKYGIKVIVDVVANHTTTNQGDVDSSLRNISGGLYHNNNGSISYSSRKSVTQDNLIGLPDLNTQNTNVQNVILKFLKQAVADGADGFRYDAAKHIELPDDDSSYASNFWPVVLNNGSSFQYGEILQDDTNKTDRISAYSEYMHVTASSYGYILREQIEARKLTATKLSQYFVTGVTSDRLVTWVESHDNYCDDGTWRNYTDKQVRLCWAIAVAQGDTTSLFFNRPKGSSTSSQFGSGKIGETGNNNYYDDEVVAVNKFHNAMYGQDKELKNLDSNNAVLMISRGSSGVTIVNDSTSDYSVNTDTSLPDGSYTDYAHGGTFTVSNGTLTGKVGAEQIAVIYSDNIVRDPSVSISYDGSNSGGEFYDTAEVTLKSNYAVSSSYQLGSGDWASYNSGDTITIGANMSEGESVTLTLTASGAEGTTPVTKTYTFTKVSRPQISGKTVVYYDNSSTNWEKVCVYVYRDNGNVKNADWPGVEMTDLGNDLWGYAIDESWNDAYVIFNNNNNGQQNPSGAGFTISKGESKIYTDNSWQTYTTPVVTTPTTVATTAPVTTQPVTTAPVTTVPVTTQSATTSPVTTQPTTEAVTTEPVTTQPVTTVPVTTVAQTTAEQTTDAPTTVTTAPITTDPIATAEIAVYGDANCDGQITISDVTAIQKHLAGQISLTTEGYMRAQVRASGNLTIKDATCIQKYVLNMTSGVGLTGTQYK